MAAVPMFGENHAPTVTGGNYTTNEDVAVSGTIAASDADGDPVVLRVVSAPQHGTVSGISDAGEFTYTPSADYNGSDSFTVAANDGTADSGEATVSITISPVNDAPVANDDVVETDEDTVLTGMLTATDVDEGDTHTFRITTRPEHGRVDLSPSGGFTYTPNPNFNGWDSFGFVARDATLDSKEATIFVIVNPVNDAPEARPLKISVAPGQTLVAQLPGFDVDTDTITYAKAGGPDTINVDRTGRFSYTPSDAKFKGTVTFQYTVNDGKETSPPGTVTIFVGNETVGFVADTLIPSITRADFNDGGIKLDKSEGHFGTATDVATDRVNRRLYVLTSRALNVYDVDATVSPPSLTLVTSVDTISGTHLALSLDARTAYIGTAGKVTAINLYPESVFAGGKSVLVEAYKNVRTYAVAPADRPLAAMAVHPAGDRLFVVIDMDPAQKKININNDLLRSDLGNGVRADDPNLSLPDDFGFITQLDISADVQTDGKPREAAKFAAPLSLKDLIYTTDKRVAIGVKSLAFSPDGNCAFLAAVGAQTVRATAFGIMPTSDEATGGIVVLDVRPLADTSHPFARYLSFIPTTEKGEKTAELRHQIQREGWKIVHPLVQYARGSYLAAQGIDSVSQMNQFTAPVGQLTSTVATLVLDELERSYRDYGYMQAYYLMYPHDMVGASSVAIDHHGGFGVVTMQDTNNLGLLSLAPSTTVGGYGPGSPPDFFIAIGTGKTVNGFNAALPLVGPTLQSPYSWAYPQKVTFTSDDSRIYLGMAGGTPKADLSNKFGSADALSLLAFRDLPDSPVKRASLAPGYNLFGEGQHESPRLVATLNAFDTDHDMLSDELEAYNRWNSLKPISADWKTKLVSTDADHLTDPGKPNSGIGGLPDALDFGYMLPPSGVGYRLNTFGMPPESVNFALKGLVSTIERMGCEWDQRFRGPEPAISADVTITRPYFVVGLLSQPGGGVLKDASGEALKYSVTSGAQVDFPYFSENSDGAHDFVTSNDPSSPLDNSVETAKGFDKPNTEALIRLLLAQPLVKSIELDPYILKLIPDLEKDPRIIAHGRLYVPGRTEAPEDRRDLDNHMLVTFFSIEVDLDIDSDNSGKIDGNLAEDMREAVVGTGGKFVPVNGGDKDGDGIPDYADFDIRAPAGVSAKFTPMVIRFPDQLDLTKTQFRMIYSESDPTDVVLSGSPPYQYSLPHTGAYRIWIKDGDVARNIAPIDAGGDFIKANTNYVVQLLLDKGMSAGTNRSVTVYLEAVEPGITPSEREVVVEVVPNVGAQSSLGTLSDTVSVNSALAALAVDADRDGHIRLRAENDSDLTTSDKPFRFWINDDNDNGSISKADIPGSSTPDGQQIWVQGFRDLVDFFPVFIDAKQLVAVLPPGPSIKYKLKNADDGIRFVYTDLNRSDAFKYLKDYDTGNKFKDAAAHWATASGYELDADWLSALKNSEKGVILVEGRNATQKPLVLSVERSDGTVLVEAKLDLRIVPVETMFRHLNLHDRNLAGLVGDNGGKLAHPEAMGDPEGFPDNPNSDERWLVFLHGFNVNGEQSRGWLAEMFKRCYWSGNRSRFVGVSWFGSPNQVFFQNISDYHLSVRNAMATAPELAKEINNLPGAPTTKTLFAHSLGCGVISSAIADHGMQIGRVCFVDAALALECFDGRDTDPEHFNDENKGMTPAVWKPYSPTLYAANWFTHFDPTTDARSKLTWIDRFTRSDNGQTDVSPYVYNFYSSTEDVLAEYTGELPSTLGGIAVKGHFGLYGWVFQEKGKGNRQNYGIAVKEVTHLGSYYMGWGMNLKDPALSADIPYWKWVNSEDYIGRLIKTPGEIGSVSDSVLGRHPVFEPGWGVVLNQEQQENPVSNVSPVEGAPSWIYKLYGGLEGKTLAADPANRAQLLAEGIPALTWCMGSHQSTGLQQGRNIALTTLVDATHWPRGKPDKQTPEWRHSDMREIAYIYEASVFDRIVSISKQ